MAAHHYYSITWTAVIAAYLVINVLSSDQYQLMSFKTSDFSKYRFKKHVVLGNVAEKGDMFPESWLEHLSNIYSMEHDMVFAWVDLNSFTWDDGSEPVYVNTDSSVHNVSHRLVVIQKEIRDRTCLLSTSHLKHPTFTAYRGPDGINLYVRFINRLVGKFRDENGSLHSAGKHREDILNNVFSVKSVSSLDMKSIHSSCQNPELREDESSFDEEFDRVWPYYGKPSVKDTCESTPSSLKPKIPECERIKTSDIPDRSVFFNYYVKKSKPVVIEGLAKSWTAYSKWSNDFFRQSFGDNRVHIKMTPSGDFEGVEKAELWENYKTFIIPEKVKDQLLFPDLVVARPAPVDMKFSEFLDIINQTASNQLKNVSAYLEYTSLTDYMEVLKKDIDEPHFAKDLFTQRHVNIWLSDGRTIGRLHFDAYDNLLCQLSGQKQVMLFEPHDNTQLYESHIPEATYAYNKKTNQFRRKTLETSTALVMSPVDLLNPDFVRFPLFSKAHPLNCTINEGDILYLPSFWWHEVHSFPSKEPVQRNLAVNFWYEPFLTKEFPCADCKLDVNRHYHHLL